jgi:hypothetical protein
MFHILDSINRNEFQCRQLFKYSRTFYRYWNPDMGLHFRQGVFVKKVTPQATVVVARKRDSKIDDEIKETQERVKDLSPRSMVITALESIEEKIGSLTKWRMSRPPNLGHRVFPAASPRGLKIYDTCI